MKKIFTSIFILIISISVIISFSLVGCTSETDTTTEAETQEETVAEETVAEETTEEGPIFLGLAAHGIRNAWEDLYVKGFQWYCDELGIAYTVTESGYDAAMQITQAKRIITQRIPWIAKQNFCHKLPLIFLPSFISSPPLFFKATFLELPHMVRKKASLQELPHMVRK